MTAPLVDPAAHVAPSATLDPGVVVQAGVVVHEGAHIRAGTILMQGTTIGAHSRVGPYAVIGGEPMDSAFTGEESYVHIGEHADIREFVTIHRATGHGAATTVGNGALLMSYVHASHNVHIGANAVITTVSQLGGHVHVGERAVLGSGAMIHQFVRIGAFAMVGATSAVNRDVLPFSMVRGNIAVHYRANAVGLARNGFSKTDIAAIGSALRALRKNDTDRVAELAAQSVRVAELQKFITESKRGVSGFVRR